MCFLSFHRCFALRVTALSFFRFLCYYPFVIIHFLLSMYYIWFPTATTRCYIYIRLPRATNRRSSTETKLKIMQLNLYLTLMSQTTYGPKEVQFECKHTHMVESSWIQMICFAMKGLHRGLFNFIFFLSCYDIFVNIRGCYINT